MAIVTHISEADAVRDFASLLTRVRAGEEIIIESEAHAVAVLRSPDLPRRTISESIALARQHEEEIGDSPVIDADYAADMEEIIRNRKPWNPPAWD